MINIFAIEGRATADAEIREVGTSKVAKFTVAVNGAGGKVDGEYQSAFFNVEAWGDYNIDKAEKFVKRGALIGVTGSLAQNKYEKDGQKVTITFLKATNISSCEKRKEEDTEVVKTSGKHDPLDDL